MWRLIRRFGRSIKVCPAANHSSTDISPPWIGFCRTKHVVICICGCVPSGGMNRELGTSAVPDGPKKGLLQYRWLEASDGRCPFMNVPNEAHWTPRMAMEKCSPTTETLTTVPKLDGSRHNRSFRVPSPRKGFPNKLSEGLELS